MRSTVLWVLGVSLVAAVAIGSFTLWLIPRVAQMSPAPQSVSTPSLPPGCELFTDGRYTGLVHGSTTMFPGRLVGLGTDGIRIAAQVESGDGFEYYMCEPGRREVRKFATQRELDRACAQDGAALELIPIERWPKRRL